MPCHGGKRIPAFSDRETVPHGCRHMDALGGSHRAVFVELMPSRVRLVPRNGE